MKYRIMCLCMYNKNNIYIQILRECIYIYIWNNSFSLSCSLSLSLYIYTYTHMYIHLHIYSCTCAYMQMGVCVYGCGASLCLRTHRKILQGSATACLPISTCASMCTWCANRNTYAEGQGAEWECTSMLQAHRGHASGPARCSWRRLKITTYM